MGFQIFPRRTPEERQAERRNAMLAAKWFALVALAGLGLIVVVAMIQPAWESWWTTIGFIGVIAALFGTYLTLQSLFEFTIAATIGIERAIAIAIAMVAAGGLLAWFTAW